MKISTWLQMGLMATQYLGRRKLRTVLTTLAIVFGVALIFAMNLVLPGFEKAMNQSISDESEGIDLTLASPIGEAFLPSSATETLLQTEGVRAVTGTLIRRIILPENQQFGDITQIELVGVDLAQVHEIRDYALKDGRFIENSGETVVASGIADTGETISVTTPTGLQSYTVVGVLDDSGAMAEVLISLEDAQAALNQPGRVSLLEVAFESGVNKETLTKQIKAQLGDQYLYNSTSDAGFGVMDVASTIFNLFGMLALFLGGFLIFNTFRTVVTERRRDLGMLRAIGATRQQILQLILIESLLQGLVGVLIGLLLGYGMALWLLSVFTDALKQFTVIRIGILVTPSAFVLPVGLGLLCTLVAGYWPARRASRISPLEALRPAVTTNVRQMARWSLIVGFGLMVLGAVLMAGSAETTIMGAIVFLGGAVAAAPGLVLPASRLFQPLLTLWFSREGDIARGNMTRQPGRAAITASTLMIGLATFILMAAVVNSFSDLIDRLLDGFFVNDVVIMPNAIGSYSSIVGADPAVVDEIRSLPDVDTVSSVQHAASSKDGERLEIYGIDPAVYSRLTPMVFTRGDSATAYSELPQGRNAILNPVSALVLGVDVGDTFELQTLDGKQTYHVVGVASDYLNFKIASVFISQDNLHADFQSDEAIMIMVTARDGADVGAVTNEIKQIMQAYPQFTVEESSSYQKELREVSRFSMRSMYFLGLLILIPATLGLLNTLTINVLERTREIGIVRAIGGDRKQIQRMILAEALLLCLFGAAIGVVVGVALSYAFTMGLSLIGWELDYIFPLMGIIAAIVIAVLLALFSSILPARNAARLDIIRALQYE